MRRDVPRSRTNPQGDLPRGQQEVRELEAESLLRSAIAHFAGLCLITTQALAGRTLLVRLGVTRDLRPLEQLGFGWAAGFTLSASALMLAAGAGLLGGVAASSVFLGLALLSLPSLRDMGAQSAAVVRERTRATRSLAGTGIAFARLRALLPALLPVLLLVLLLGLFLAFLGPLVVQTLLPNTDWDSALYQLPLAERYLEGRRLGGLDGGYFDQLFGQVFGRDPYFPAFSFPGAANLLYAGLLALGLEAAIAPLNFYAALLTLALTCALGHRLGGRAAGSWAVLVLASVPLFWQVGVDARIDGFLCLAVLLVFQALCLFANGRDHRSLKLLGLSLGAALGCKYTGVFFAGALGGLAFLLLLWQPRASSGVRIGARSLVATLALVLLPNGLWYAANVAIHGDPLYPMIRGSYVRTDDGGRVLLPSQRESLTEGLLDAPTRRRSDEGLSETPIAEHPTNVFDLFDLLRNPDAYSVKPNHGVGPLPYLSLLLPLLLMLSTTSGKRSQRLPLLVAWAGAWGCYAVLGSQTNLLRYVLPVFPALAALTGVAIARLPFGGVRLLVLALGALLMFSSYVAERARLEVLRAEEGLALPREGLAGWEREARILWLQAVGYNFTPAMPLAAEQINAFIRNGRMRPEDLVLMIGEGKGRLLDCGYLPDGSWFAHRFVAELQNAKLDHDALARRLHEKGVTHVLYNAGYFEDWVLPMTQTARSRVAFMQVHAERFLDERGETIFRGPGMRLVALREPSTRTTRPAAGVPAP